MIFSARKANVARPKPMPKMKKALVRSLSWIGTCWDKLLRGFDWAKHFRARGTSLFTQNGIWPLSQSNIKLQRIKVQQSHYSNLSNNKTLTYALVNAELYLLSFVRTTEKNADWKGSGSLIWNRQMPSFLNWRAIKNLQYDWICNRNAFYFNH